jgi:hypothetical protein
MRSAVIHGDHVAGIHGHLPAEPAADVRRHDADLLLREPHVARHQGEDRPDRVGRLGCHVDREFPLDRIEVGDAATGLDGRHVDARDVEILLDHDVRLPERAFGRGPVAALPVEDAIVGLALLVRAQDRGAGFEGLEGVHHHRKRLVVHLHGLRAVRGRVAVGGDYRCHLL